MKGFDDCMHYRSIDLNLKEYSASKHDEKKDGEAKWEKCAP